MCGAKYCMYRNGDDANKANYLSNARLKVPL